ncbi:granule-bound starch synthase [Chloropicon primus]|uniref:Starch synthase, chloroplastic/amyloplastic n=2 Tax=Chloropicon primus TaxID=1764295 RepID=A0A5B8MYA0_9CHLO|nr:starch synthase [Chloropicon primus]UPR03803.1 granule-bound starch synthase [Chloropicon primus]|eukprot:QDZ24595.1 starch synthase [Chloropicon primus]
MMTKAAARSQVTTTTTRRDVKNIIRCRGGVDDLRARRKVGGGGTRAVVVARAEKVAAAAAAAAAPDKPLVELPHTPQDIVFVAAEVAPWSKTGGLGDVVGGLPVELAKRGHRVMTVAPRYDQYSDAWDTSVVLEIMGEKVGFFHSKKKGVDRVFVDHPCFLAKVWGKTGSKLYGLKSGADFIDNSKRFRMFCEAAIEAARCLPFSYGENVTFVANDWHSALVPVLLRDVYKPSGQFADAKCAFCVHNIAFQGRFWEDTWDTLGLPESSKELFAFEDGYNKVYSELTPADESEKLEDASELGTTYGKLNWMQAGFYAADRNITVSPNYAEEVVADASKGVELDKIIEAAGGIEGIVNGMDNNDFNPVKDKYIPVKYGPNSVAEGKAAAKEALQAELGLEVDATIPLMGFIGRLEEQKGVDILLKAIPEIQERCKCQVVVLGTGKKKFEKLVKNLDVEFPENVKGVVKFSTPLAHLIFAGSDFLAIPSRFEPCGLIQLQAMTYGSVPIVSSTGGLVDTVKEGVTGFHIGALDADELTEEDASAVATTVARAVETYGSEVYASMSRKCISQDLSWAEPAKKWEAVIEEMKSMSVEATEKKESVSTPVVKV